MNASPIVPSPYALHFGVSVHVAAKSHVHPEALIVGVLPVEPGGADVAERRQVGVERLEREGDSHLGDVVDHVAAAEPEVEAGAIDIFVRVLQDHDRLVVDPADPARVDVAADAVVQAECRHPRSTASHRPDRVVRLGGLGSRRRRGAERHRDRRPGDDMPPHAVHLNLLTA